ncbi:MAG: ABC transporter ATP-binding protein [Rectinemataceae bacterium]
MSGQGTFKRSLRYLRGRNGAFALAFLSMLAVIACQVSLPLVLRTMIDQAIPARDTAGMLRLAILYVAIVLSAGGAGYIQNLTVARLGLDIVTAMKKDIFERLLTMPVSHFDAHPVGELIARTESDAERVRDLFSRIGLSLVANILFFAGMVAVCFSLEPGVTAWVAVFTPPLMAAVFFAFDKLRPRYDKSRSLNAKITAAVAETLQGFEVIKAFGREAWARTRLDASAKPKRDNDVSSMLLERLAMSVLGFAIGPLFIAIVIRTFVPRILAGAMTVGTLLVFLDYGRRLLDPLMEIAENVRALQTARVSLKRIMDSLDLEGEKTGGATPPPLADGIEFRDIWFKYGEEWVLKGVSFEIPRGSHIALVGPSGSGKSTTVGLLCKFYEAQEGGIYVDGKLLAELDTAAWRRKIGLVLQESHLFPGTILENVRVYDDTVPESAVRRAIGLVQAGEIVDRLPEGLLTELRERGSNLSSGERQLLSFARALVRDPEIIVLDEATASVDVRTERRIQDAMADLLDGRTSLIVAHRLSSVLKADRILYFKDGQIAASGTHETLSRDFPEYAELVRLQFPDTAEPETSGDSI